MKNLLIAFLMILTVPAFAQKALSSDIKQVKVFKRNAEVMRSLKTQVNSGKQELVLTGISTSINPSSLQIRFKNASSILLSAKYEPNHILAKSNNPKIDALKLQSEDLNDELSWVVDQKNGLLGMEEVLKKNQDLGGQSGFTPAQVMELSNKYRTKYLEIRKELKGVLKEEKALKQKIAGIQGQLNEMKARFNKPSGTIVLQLSAPRSESLNIECTYTVNNAGWNPLYDIRSNGISSDVKLSYKANIFQNTGQDWNEVDVTVSTGNPTQNNSRPILNPLYVRMMTNYLKDKKKGETASASMKNMAMEFDRKSPMASGYEHNAQISENQLNVEFEIQKRQTILSDGKKNLLALKAYELPTHYVYHTVPKLCNGAFLLAKVTDWSKYNLVSGQANIFFEGAFVGTTQINPEITADTMLLSLGRDNGIVVERKPIEEFMDKKAIGSNKKETLGYKLIVKNKKSMPIEIEILDQIPVSQNNQIEVSLDEKGLADYNKNIGKLLWTAKISSRESWEDQFVYTVKYPKNNAVAGLK